MDPITSSFSALHATYQILLFSVDIDQAPSQVRRSLELVQTCHRDLQYLIELRNECLPLLQKTPVILRRVNDIIENADQGLIEVCRIVEKCRPDANNGSVPLKNRLTWVLFDSREFRAQEPVISRHHASVLSEMNFLRQTALLAPAIQQPLAKSGDTKKTTEIFDNVALLGDLMGQMSLPGSTSSFSQAETSILTSTALNHPRPMEPLPPYTARHPSFPTYPPNSNSNRPQSTTHFSFSSSNETKAPFNSTLQSTPHPDPLIDVLFQGPAFEHEPSKFDIKVPESMSYPSSLTSQRVNKTQETLVETASTYEPSIAPSHRSSEVPSHHRMSSSSSIPILRGGIDPSAGLDLLPEQPSESHSASRPSFTQRFSQYLGTAKGLNQNHAPNRNESPRHSLGHPPSYDMNVPSHPPVRTNTTSTVTGKWYSPDSVHVWSSPDPPPSVVDSDARTLRSPSPAFTSHASVSSLSLSTIKSEESERPRPSFQPGYMNALRTPTPLRQRSDSAGPQAWWKPPAASPPQQSAAMRTQGNSTTPAMVFGASFWGPDALSTPQQNNSSLTRPQPEPPRSVSDYYGALGSVPDFSGIKHEGTAGSYAGSTYHASAVPSHVYELSSTQEKDYEPVELP